MFGLLSFATLLLTIAVLIATATGQPPELPRLARLRVATTVCAALLVVSSAAGVVSGLALGTACIAFVLSLHASWLAMREPPTLQAYLDRLTAGGDAAWRDEFERPLRDYICRRQDARNAGQP